MDSILRNRTHALAVALMGAICLAGCKSQPASQTDTSAAAGEVAKTDSARIDTTNAATPAAAPGTTTNNNGWTDAQILAFANTANSGEIAMGRMAERKAANPAVKAFARQMVADHEAMLRDCLAFEKANHITPDTTKSDVTDLSKDVHDTMNDWKGKAAGKDWDGAYMDKQIDAHKAVLSKLQDAENATTNAKLKDMLTKAVGKVQEHLTKAQDVKQNQLKA